MTDAPLPHNSPHVERVASADELAIELAAAKAPRVEGASCSYGWNVVNALLRLANDTKVTTRSVAIDELEAVIQQAHRTAESQRGLELLVPALTTMIQLSSDTGVTADLIRLSGTAGEALNGFSAQSAPCGASRESGPLLLNLGGAIAAKLYAPSGSIPPIIAHAAFEALARIAPAAAVTVHPLLTGLENDFPDNVRLARNQEAIAAAAAGAEPAPAPVGPASTLKFWFRAGGGRRIEWSEHESRAVAALIERRNEPPPPFDALFSQKMWAEEQRIRDAIATLGRFAARNKGDLTLSDGIRASVALTACLDSPVHDLTALQALKSFGASGTPALPAVLDLASSRRHSLATRGEAIEVAALIAAKLPASAFAAPGQLGSEFLDRAEGILRGLNPLLAHRTLGAILGLGERAKCLAGAIEASLRSDLDEFAVTAASDAALQPSTLAALEALARIDPSGHAASAAMSRTFSARRNSDEVQHQLLAGLGELIEREHIAVEIGDPMLARIVETPGLSRQIIGEAYHLCRRCERTLGRPAAAFPLTTTALLRSPRIQPEQKDERLSALAENGRHHRLTVRAIIMAAYKEVAADPRLDERALDLLRYLR